MITDLRAIPPGPIALYGFGAVGRFVFDTLKRERPDLQINMFAWAIKDRNKSGIVPQPFSAFGLSPVHLTPSGRGTVRLIGPEALFRAQPAGTFKLVFNGLIGTR